MIISPIKLNKRGILGMNQRNIDFIGKYNDRSKYPLVDNKLKTKQIAQETGIRVPKLIAVVTKQHEITPAVSKLMDGGGFAIKPAKGSGGKGIWVIKGLSDNGFIKTSGAEVSVDDLERHLSNILAGLYSLSGTPDVAIIETLIDFDDLFADLSFQGVPDIRLIIFKGYPVMAMLRCATRASDGKANLHQGAIGIGLDIATGRSTHAVQFSKSVHTHPDTGASLLNVSIPKWRDLLMLSSQCYEMTGLGYMGTDIVLDKRYGPMLLELNARPGLAIQIANRLGLIHRLETVDTLADKYRSPRERVSLATELFSANSRPSSGR